MSFLVKNMSKANAIMDCNKTLQLFEVMLEEYKRNEVSKEEVLCFNQRFASTIYGLQLSPVNISKGFNDSNFKKGIKIYLKTLSLIEKKRKEKNVFFERERP
jgi:hypothetical protein